MRRRGLLVVAIGAVLLSVGCASLSSSVPFQYQPSLLSSGRQIQKNIGLSLLADARPENDQKYTKSIHDLPEKVSAKLIDDFRSSNLFLGVHYPPKDTDDLLITGTIKRFKWKFYDKPIVYIPYVGLLVALCGAPVSDAYGITELQLDVKDRAVGTLLGTFSAYSKVENGYTMYNIKAGESGAELAESFREVSKKLKEDMALKLLR